MKKNQEDFLVPLMAEIAVKPRHNAVWPRDFPLPLFPAEIDFGSPNIRGMASTAGLWHKDTRSVAIESWLRAAEMERTIGFELEEPGSRIYRAWSLIARLNGYRWAVQEGREELIRYFREWLALYWHLESLAALDLPDGPISLRCGARSQGAFGRLKSDYALSIASGKAWSWRRKPHSLPDASWQRSHEVNAFEALRPEIEETWARREELLPRWPTIAPTNYYRSTKGLAVWCEKSDVNGNTPGIAAMVWTGEMRTAPSPSRAHIRQKRVPQKIWREGQSLFFKQHPPGTPEELEIPLPSGDVIYEFRHGESGLEVPR